MASEVNACGSQVEKGRFSLFEFNGWAVLRVDDSDDPDVSEITRREEEARTQLGAAVQLHGDDFSVFEVRAAGNGFSFLTLHGLRNHRYSPAIDVFQWVADHMPFAYGLLYVWDDEDNTPTRGDNTNCFRVWKLARGVLTEEADSYLSPCIPVIEPPGSNNGA